MALSDINARIFRVSTLAGKAEKRAFFQILAGKAGKHHLLLLPWLEKLEFYFFHSFQFLLVN